MQLLLRTAGEAPTTDGTGSFKWMDLHFPEGPALEEQLAVCRTYLEGSTMVWWKERVLALYHLTLQHRKHAKFVPLRKASEAFVENFNPWLLLGSESNISVELITHTVNKAYRYCTKGGGGREGVHDAAAEVLDGHKEGNVQVADLLAEKIKAGWKEVSLGEAMFRLDRTLHLSDSLFSVVFVAVEAESNQLEGGQDWDDPEEDDTDICYVVGKTWSSSSAVKLYTIRWACNEVELFFILLFRPASVELLTFGQFLMWYCVAPKGTTHRTGRAVKVITSRDEPPLPPTGTLTLPQPLNLHSGTLLRCRARPLALDWAPKSEYADVLLFTVCMIFQEKYKTIILTFDLRLGGTQTRTSSPTRIPAGLTRL